MAFIKRFQRLKGKRFGVKIALDLIALQLFEQCAAESIRCVDYGFGDAEYKRVYGTRCWDESILRIYGPSWRARLDRYGSRTSRLVGDVLRKLPASKRLLKRMKRAWRDRLTEAQQKR